MPCWKIITGQPASGIVCPDVAFGTAISTGIVWSPRLAGAGSKRVTTGPAPDAGIQKPPSAAAKSAGPFAGIW